jgi:single-stranded-DNA-specific exonuclease
MPDCLIINPKIKAGDPKENTGYPFEMLSGTGVAFKLCRALLDRVAGGELCAVCGEPRVIDSAGLKACLHSMVDLVCVATIADVMPLIDENRTFVKYGLSMLRKGTRPAFRELFSVAGIAIEQVDVHDVAFGVSPRINALGRLGNASAGVELLLTNDKKRIKELSLHMNALNSERRSIQDECFDKCMKLYEKDLNEEGKPKYLFLLLRPDGSYEGVAGIVAGKIREETGLPCAVLSRSQDNKEMLKGSARSGGGLNIVDLLKEHDELLERYGGHAAAAGFTIREENENLLRENMSLDIEKRLTSDPDLLSEKKEAELEIDFEDITQELANALTVLAPFGKGNLKPLLSLRVPASGISGIRFMGQGGKHIKFLVNGLTCIFFRGAETVFSDTGTVGILGFPEVNTWNGRSIVQFAVEHVENLV